MSNYQVVSVLVESYPGPTPTIVQLDAPAGFYVAETFALADGASTYEAKHPLEYLVDSEDRVTGVKFIGNEEIPNQSTDYTAFAVCVRGEAAPSGSATLLAGTVNVPFPAVTAASRILLEHRTAAGITAGNVYRVSARNPGTGFTLSAIVLATGVIGALDTSTIDWVLIEP